jgi:tRNA 5-methylaminomethyl-2-thiouridine biosynthesis bifunctional protein
MKGAPRSEHFDDIYFSADDGLAETQHVFLNGNNLPEAWAGQERFIIAETGFGTGLNFLSAWKLFEETSKPDQTLDFISVEKYPLSPEFIREALQPWAEYFEGRLDILVQKYPLRVAGFHRVKINSQITLTLIFDDVIDAYAELDAQVDCWFLDGFTPAKNPEMWRDELYTEMARLSHDQTSFASFTAAGDVRRGLESVGFEVQKRDGFGRKRDMIVGTFKGDQKKSIKPKTKKVAIIGGGLAGTSCAYVLKQYGFEPVIYEASHHLAAGASGNSTGFYNPRFTAQRDAVSNFFAPAYAQFTKLAQEIGREIEHDGCGAMHLINSPEKEKRFKSLIEKWSWHDDHVRILSAEEASEIAGITLEHDVLYLPDSGGVSPKKLCEYHACDIEVNLNSKINDLESVNADAIIICNASAAKEFDYLSWLPLETVRGQVSLLEASEQSKDLKCNIHYGGYISANHNGAHMCGATFQKWEDHTDIIEDDHQHNIESLKANIPLFENSEFKVQSGWAGLRTATNDRFPAVGEVPDKQNIYLATAFGSHGLVGSLMSAHYLADCLRDGPKCLPQMTSKTLKPKRFLDRMRKKGQI